MDLPQIDGLEAARQRLDRASDGLRDLRSGRDALPAPLRPDADAFRRDDHLRGNVLKSRIGNFLPPPDKGAFPSDFRANSQLFLDRIQRILRDGGAREL